MLLIDLGKELILKNDSLFNVKIALYDMTKRINIIEDSVNLDYKFWFPTLIAVIAIIITLYQYFFKNKNDLYYKIEESIDNSKLLFAEKLLEIETSDLSSESKIDRSNIYLRHRLSKIDDGCRMYLDNKINRKVFRYKYHNTIIELVKKNQTIFNEEPMIFDSIDYYYKCFGNDKSYLTNRLRIIFNQI